MATIQLNSDFKEFLKLLNAKHIEYLVVGGYAVIYHGYSRATGDIDIWIAVNPENAQRMSGAVREFFGGTLEEASPALFLKSDVLVRMGVPPARIEIMTSISGAVFDDCYKDRIVDDLDGVPVNLIGLKQLKENKKASGRYKDLADLEKLP